MSKEVKLPVKWGLSDLPPMTRAGAERYGWKHADRSLLRAGFEVFVCETNVEINGWHGFRINLGKRS